ncbi:hypothetical protein FTUN_5810 [Frigoriglobus tundricola]|uniref:DUF1990 domain-containing protein n=2 Tax=Frigoriglobus tundricola TaxID=2774151 RepID=A0A6M5YXU8_9BACT|nr:hypothetical protein FTUN_5810 [Frigoriglobus tundricola]
MLTRPRRALGDSQAEFAMPFLSKPSRDVVRDFIAAQARLDYTYPALGATASEPPPGYVVDRTRVELGAGEDTFRAARAALARWDHFGLGWVEAAPADTPIEVGAVVAVAARVMGVWWLNACRIVYVVDDDGPVRRSGFAYGTLPGHAESGEERFLIEWDRASDGVWYDVLAFSRPRHPLARLGYPLTRRTQRRFARDSARAMQAAVRR